jgi:hypothetical protein
VDTRLIRLVKCHAPQLLDVVGIGPDTAVALLITVGDHNAWTVRRPSPSCRAFLGTLAVPSPQPWWRPQANAALHRIVIIRLRVDPRTPDYYERRIKEGKARREIVRRFKGYAARDVFHLVGQLQPGPRS